jgi:hypothetical protein
VEGRTLFVSENNNQQPNPVFRSCCGLPSYHPSTTRVPAQRDPHIVATPRPCLPLVPIAITALTTHLQAPRGETRRPVEREEEREEDKQMWPGQEMGKRWC